MQASLGLVRFSRRNQELKRGFHGEVKMHGFYRSCELAGTAAAYSVFFVNLMMFLRLISLFLK